MSTRIETLITELQQGGAQTIALFRSLAPEQWQAQVYMDGAQWRVRDVLAHFVTIERSMHWLFRNIASGGEGSPRDFDLDRFNVSQTAKLADVPPDMLIAQFTGVRAETISIVKSLAEDDLDRVGRHPVHGTDRLEVFIRWAVRHSALHEADIHRALGIA